MAVAITVGLSQPPVSVASDGSNKTTYAGMDIGAAGNDKEIVLCIAKELATVVVNSVTMDDGTGAKSMDLINGTTFASMGAWMYRASGSAAGGTTATFVITWSGAMTAAGHYLVDYYLNDAAAPQSYSGTNTSTDMDATAPLTTGSTIIATGGGMIAVGAGAAVGFKTWANLTSDTNGSGGTFNTGFASSTVAGTATRTCTGTTNGEDGVLVWAHFTDSVLPPSSVIPVIPPKAIAAGPLTSVPVSAAGTEMTMPPFRAP